VILAALLPSAALVVLEDDLKDRSHCWRRGELRNL